MLDTEPLRIAPFRRLWTSTVVTAVGSQFAAVAVPKQIFDITGSSGWVGLTGLFGLVPLLVFGLWGGAIADTVDRRKLMIVTNLGIAATGLMLWAAAAVNTDSVWTVLLLYALQQSFFAVNMPARTASVARLVSTAQLPAAQALTATVAQLGAVVGPLLAGILLPFVGLSTLYLVDALLLLVALAAVWRLPAMPPSASAPRRPGLRSVLDGMRYMRTHTVLVAVLLLDVIAMVFGLPRALFPEMAERTFGDPPGGGPALGLLYAALPLGGLLFGLFSGWVTRIRRQGAGLVIAGLCWGVAVVGFGLADSLWLAVLFLAVGGAADLVGTIYRGALLQTVATDDMRGRTQGVFLVVVAGGPRLADVVHGAAGASVGTAAATAGGGVLVVVLTIVGALLMPAVWRYRPPLDEDTTARGPGPESGSDEAGLPDVGSPTTAGGTAAVPDAATAEAQGAVSDPVGSDPARSAPDAAASDGATSDGTTSDGATCDGMSSDGAPSNSVPPEAARRAAPTGAGVEDTAVEPYLVRPGDGGPGVVDFGASDCGIADSGIADAGIADTEGGDAEIVHRAVLHPPIAATGLARAETMSSDGESDISARNVGTGERQQDGDGTFR
ncbi:Enterobactin exporter EntS [Actinoalloteichus hoggarensis]|uniref:Enterobactin exporter EntS n=2 Tax=Actinoalloteichus hoggarensis TaxID=1470176 RepID=A0A221WB49_9PSEU|nr:Enterobactin exporter EntS [Actinoalloteichus hoggarensis]